MIDALEKRLIEALKSVDAHGDVAPAHVHCSVRTPSKPTLCVGTTGEAVTC